MEEFITLLCFSTFMFILQSWGFFLNVFYLAVMIPSAFAQFLLYSHTAYGLLHMILRREFNSLACGLLHFVSSCECHLALESARFSLRWSKTKHSYNIILLIFFCCAKLILKRNLSIKIFWAMGTSLEKQKYFWVIFCTYMSTKYM